MTDREDPSTLLGEYILSNFPSINISDHTSPLSTKLRNFAMYPTVTPSLYNTDPVRCEQMINRMIALGETLAKSGQTQEKLLELARFTMSLFPNEVSPITIKFVIEQLSAGITDV